MTIMQLKISEARAERIDIRTTEKLKNLLAYAAEISGVSMSTFLVEAGREKADKILEQQDTLVLNNKERDQFFKCLESFDKPTAKLEKAMQQYLLIQGKG